MKLSMRSFVRSCLLLAILVIPGCSANTGPILPQGELTPEQLEKIRKEDRNVENEESQGSVKN